MRAIVTGGAGFIGSNLLDALVARGDEAHALDDLSRGSRDNVTAPARLHVADIRDPDAVFDAVRPEVVFHLAAQADVRVSVDRPGLDAEINVLGTIRILEAARRHGARVVFASSGGAAYGECDGPMPETSPLEPLAPYGTSKLCGEAYLATWNRLHGTGNVSLRLGNVYGPRQMPHGEAGVVAIFMGLLHEGGTPTIFGDGLQTRDYVYVGDVVEALLLAPARTGGVFNIGSGVETSVVDLYRAVRAAAGAGGEPVHAPARLGELQRSVLDPSLARRELGWVARHSLGDGLAKTWSWISSGRRS